MKSNYELDLQYAKDIVELRDGFLNSEMDNHGYIKKFRHKHIVKFSYTLPLSNPIVMSFSELSLNMSSFGLFENDYTLEHTDGARTRLWINDEHGYVYASDVSYSEEFYFQLQTLYSNEICRKILVYAYLVHNSIPPEYSYYKSYRINMDYFKTMHQNLLYMRFLSNQSVNDLMGICNQYNGNIKK